MRLRHVLVASTVPSLTLLASLAYAEVPDGAAILRALGPRAEAVFAPVSGQVGGLVPLPGGADARALGLDPVAPGFGRLRGPASHLLGFASAHPALRVDVAPPLHLLLDKAGQWTNAAAARQVDGIDGTGVLVGVADTGLDVTHPDLRDPVTGHTRVAWLLDLSLAPVGIHSDLEQKFGILDPSGNLVAGAVFDASDIDGLLDHNSPGPQDEIGHGTHVTSIAAGNGGARGLFVGFAPKATIVFARIARDSSGTIENDDLLQGVRFLFDRADAMSMPMVANLSIGSDFGPHDGTTDWEQVLASFVGPAHPGRAFVAAAGNSGSITETPIHQSVYVPHGSHVRVPIETAGAQNGGVQVWVGMRSGASLSVGLDGPDGTWISPVGDGSQNGKNTSSYNAGVINGSSVSGSPVPSGSHGAVVIWSGAWPSGEYAVTLEGEGTADLYVDPTGDAGGAFGSSVGFSHGVREGTITLPATHPALAAVGCTVNRTSWRTIHGSIVGLDAPLLDVAGGLADPASNGRPLADGEVCWFSSAGPTLTGAPKPELSAPGGIVVAAMASQALPGQASSIFTNPSCPNQRNGSPEPDCLQVDATHAVAVGTSMSAPQAAGAAALLLQRDPTLTQDEIVALLQAGTHELRSGLPRFEDQAGPGELDVLGSLVAQDELGNPVNHLPGPCTSGFCPSWLTTSADSADADGSTPLVVILELRTQQATDRADFFDGSRLRPVVLVGAQPPGAAPQLVRKGPGLWFYSVQVPAGSGGSSLTVGATFDGVDVVRRRTIPIATDSWTASYPTTVGGSCAVCTARSRGGEWSAGFALGLAMLIRRRCRGSSRAAPARRHRDGRR